ncbi:MAG: hypothetical protein QMD07_01910 [Thermodesulfovibrionales bacterium]|nr:hypothetical protein [Thermodesulfovibrionales bacterium]
MDTNEIKRTVTVSFDDAQTSEKEMENAFLKAGFEVKRIEIISEGRSM